MVQRLSGLHAVSATALSREVGVPQPTLSAWLRHARTLGVMNSKHEKRSDSGKSPKEWTAHEKLAAVLEASGIADADLGEFLRSNGLHAAQLEEWRKSVHAALESKSNRSRAKGSPEARRIRDLERELDRKNRALAEVTALLALKKKLAALLGDEDDDTSSRNGT